MSTHNMFHGEIRKNIFEIPTLIRSYDMAKGGLIFW